MCFLAAHCNNIRVLWKPKRKNWLTGKKHIEEFVWRLSLFRLHVLLLMSVFIVFSSSPILRRKKIPPQNSRGKEGELLPSARPSVYNPARPSVYNPAILPYFDFSLPSVELIKLIGSWKKKYFQGRGKEFAHWVLNDAILNYKRKWVQTLCLPTLIVSRNF